MAQNPVEFSVSVANVGEAGGSHAINCYRWNADSASSALPVLCVHGLTRNGRDFDYLARELSQTRTVLAPDMPGRGKSEYLKDPLGYSYPAYVADIAALLKQEGITQLDWVGTSMGGIIGMMFAATFPGVIRKLVLNDIGAVVSAAGLKRIMSYAGSKSAFATRADAEAAFRERCAPFGISDEPHWQHMFSHAFAQNEDGTYRFAYDPRIMASLPGGTDLQDIELWALWPALENLPMLVVRGADSDILTHEAAIAMQTRHTKLALHELPGIGHAPALMAGDQIELITGWL
jgi:pimeloyl-ACP methyl ester carboxylesterase